MALLLGGDPMSRRLTLGYVASMHTTLWALALAALIWGAL